MSSSVGRPTALPCAHSSARTPGPHSRSLVGVAAIDTASASSPAPRPMPSITTSTTGPFGAGWRACGRKRDDMAAPYDLGQHLATSRHAPGVSDAIAELEGLRALARALAHGDADDLLQDAAVAALEHPPEVDRPVKPWLATVILNRWRMHRRGDARRRVKTSHERLRAALDDAAPRRHWQLALVPAGALMTTVKAKTKISLLALL